MEACEDALHLIVNSPCRVAGVEIGGYDTHSSQQQRRAVLDPWVAWALNSLYQCTVALHPNCTVTILVMTEFGRTKCGNANESTDHGVGGLMMALGPVVKGGVYNCHGGGGLGAQWDQLGSTSPNPRYANALRVEKDFRAIFAEYLDKRMGMTITQLDTIIPGWQALAGPPVTPLFTYQNYLL